MIQNEEKVLVLDIDGTLTNSEKQITPATKAGIQEILQRGHKVILASGRPTPGMRRYEKELELEKYGGYLLSFNGARIVECRSGEIVYQRLLSLSILPSLWRFAKEHGCGLITYLGDQVISAFEPDEYVALEARINGLPIRVVDNFLEFVDFDINKCLMTAPPEVAPEYEKQLRDMYQGIASIYRSEAFFIEIMPEHVDKASSLDHMLESLGMTRENAICCGDGFNDVSMIKYAGVGVAMGNAKDEVKEAADYVTGTNDEDGLVEVIEKFILVSIQIPENAQKILTALQEAGYEAYVVGGCVRDSILGRVPQDWDVTTSARPEQVKELFRRTIDTGIQHGTVTVMMGNEGYEVTTYRIDGKYEDNRHPSEVTFTPSLEEDLKRRDFTINAMAYNPKEGLVDLFGGMEDIRKKVIRCVGDPKARFGEDALRILRAVRFSAQLGYAIDEATKQAICELAPSLVNISAERIHVELEKLLVSDHPEFLKVAYETGITKVVLPEFDACMETPQKHPHHFFNVGDHTLESIRLAPKDRILRWTMLLHDVGKPDCLTVDTDGTTHFYGHPKLGEEMARNILRRLKSDNDTIYMVCKLVRYHDYGNEDEPDLRFVRKAINKIGEDAFPKIFEVWRADILAQSEYLREEKLAKVAKWQALYEEILSKNQCVSLKTLAITGNDLIGLGMKPGKQIGDVLATLLEEVLEEPERNRPEVLSERAKELIAGNETFKS
ncbi:MAG: CCA tRNA nucleotidyltransferase [Lachnospiraceae bacterium]|nr:CCA tRNA nucleotidyltransferase [Lachnospiraceae bacterium]